MVRAGGHAVNAMPTGKQGVARTTNMHLCGAGTMFRLQPAALVPHATERQPMTAQSLYDFEARTIDGQTRRLGDLKGHVVLIVNTASECGFTPQFAGLEKLWAKYKDRGLAVVGFPSNEFGGQDPGNDEQIASFCQVNYGVSFPMMSKIEVNGANAHPLYQWLKQQAPGLLGTQGIKWNFTKFLVGRDGQVIKRYAPNDTPESLEKDILAALAA
jgi:glutathione peroxidase